MQPLPSSEQQEFTDKLVNDLSFIKKRLRYPLRRMTIMPLFASGIMGGFLLRFMFAASVFKTNNFLVWLLLLILVCLPIIITLKRYIVLIRFFPVTTPFLLQDNIKLLQQFLQENNLLTFRHPRAPEIFMIVSKNISAIGEEREILIFIVDHRRILVNSHFTTSRRRFRLFISPTHHQQIIKELKTWLQNRNTTRGIISSV